MGRTTNSPFNRGDGLKQGPCRDCVDRKVGCHAECERYAAYKAELRAEREAKRKDEDRWFDDYLAAAKGRMLEGQRANNYNAWKRERRSRHD